MKPCMHCGAAVPVTVSKQAEDTRPMLQISLGPKEHANLQALAARRKKSVEMCVLDWLKSLSALQADAWQHPSEAPKGAAR